ncbi:LpqN/LpqT family lipoprotein [Mycolicibacterium sediminis]|uniref:LpqN/LpqT family lipoprotein n=1 Tax=Mycolicibacterium sediminis TaxID=1286180 RepID=UPI001FEA67A3|nr:LpqN/LpqT family lipoprotein [Mycolicibacterium sediminis]
MGPTASSGTPGAPPPPAPPADAPRPHSYTIADLIKDNNLAEEALRPGNPGAPTIDLPVPPGWTDAGGQTPSWAWNAVYLPDASMSADPPNVITLVNKLTGRGSEHAFSYALGEVANLNNFQGDAPRPMQISGFNAWQQGGTFTREDGVERAIVQTTVAIPAPGGGVVIMQSNADAPRDQLQLITDVATARNAATTIAPPV